MNHFEDACHLEKIRESLWQKGGVPGASVMVGAGFSRNAIPLSPHGDPFPNWNELATGLIDALYPEASTGSSDRERLKLTSHVPSQVSSLSQEFKAAFGQTSLNSYLRSKIPDVNYEHGPLHRLLLSLPWADVLTTNYDTLLERAAKQVYERRYHVITKAENIPSSQRPRIVKLHGSFPSDTPFIFTDEDFRSYPRKFASFVNLAQQVAMETVLCLVGFSGDDPNFLQWSGWVRDNLGDSAPKIYLCGLLSISPARRKMLQDRNVIPVDLSPLFPHSVYPDLADRHMKATE